jgi:hypothetical protein
VVEKEEEEEEDQGEEWGEEETCFALQVPLSP